MAVRPAGPGRCPLQDLIYEYRRVPTEARNIRAVGDQSACNDELTGIVHGRHSQSIAQTRYLEALRIEGRVGKENKSVQTLFAQAGKDSRKIIDPVRPDRPQLKP